MEQEGFDQRIEEIKRRVNGPEFLSNTSNQNHSQLLRYQIQKDTEDLIDELLITRSLLQEFQENVPGQCQFCEHQTTGCSAAFRNCKGWILATKYKREGFSNEYYKQSFIS